jgi:small-conductance mechanosensitive channel
MRNILHYFKLAKTSYINYFKEKPLDGFYFLYLLFFPIFGNIFYIFWTTLYKQIFELNGTNIITKTIIIWFVIIIIILILIAKKLRFKFEHIIGYSLSFFVLGVICFALTKPYLPVFEIKPKYFIFESHLPEQTEENSDEYYDNVDFDDYDFPEENMVYSVKEEDFLKIEKQLNLDGKIFKLKKILFWQTGYLYRGFYQKFEDENEFDTISIFFLFGPVIIVEIIITSALNYSFSLLLLALLLMLFKKSHLLKVNSN